MFCEQLLLANSMFLGLPYLFSTLMASALLTNHVNLCNTHVTPPPPLSQIRACALGRAESNYG